MWPLTIKMPKYKEAYVIILMDKIACLLVDYSQNFVYTKGNNKYYFMIFNIIIIK